MQTGNRYDDRCNAGQALATRLAPLAGRTDVTVIGLPRGGIIVAAEVAEALAAPLDIFPVRKLAAPEHREFAIGAIGGGGVQVLDEHLVRHFQLSPESLTEIVDTQEAELERQEKFFRRFRAEESLENRIAIVVDDGAATGYTLVAAAAGVRAKAPARVVVAVPVGSVEACAQLAEIADDLICPMQPSPFHAVGLWYVHFEEVSDEEAGLRLAQTGAPTRRPGRT